MTKRMSAKQARNNFSDLLGSVYYSREPVIVEKGGRPFVAVVSLADYHRLFPERFAVLDEIRQDNAEATPEQIEADVEAEIAALRAEKAGRRRTSGGA